jgi:two-component system, NtrC family, response regulator AtoC
MALSEPIVQPLNDLSKGEPDRYDGGAVVRGIDELDTIERPGPDGGAGGLCLMVSADGRFRTHPLPERGVVSLGRSSGNAIRIEHPSVSRRHALLHVGATIEIEDLDSANGVRVQDRSVAPKTRAPVHIGETVELGEVMVVVRRAPGAVRPRRLWPHGYFEGRVEEQCARAERSRETFAVLRLGVEAAPAGAAEGAFAETLRSLDVLALYAPGEYEVMLVDTGADEAELMSRRLQSLLERSGARVRIGLAAYPRDATTPEALIARACDAVRGIVAGEPAAEATQPGLSPTMRTLRRLTEQVAASDLSVLILGETGAGKEVLAERVHRLSPRAGGPFVKLHCAAFSESLLESELFGHEKGAFTGAHAVKPGLLETAQGGTVLLDEIGELPLQTQVKLLRVLEERKVLRIGALTPRSIDVRFIAATNRDLDAEVARGTFRLDLYYRLNGVTLVIPPLRERADELELLAYTFAEQACRRANRPTVELTPEALQRLHAYSWPGNIRELRNTIERAVLLCGRGAIGVEHLPTEKMAATLPAPSPRAIAAMAEPLGEPPPPSSFDDPETTHRFARPPEVGGGGGGAGALAQQVEAFERQRILETLERCGGNQTRAARELGISRGKLIARLEDYGIPRPRK